MECDPNFRIKNSYEPWNEDVQRIVRNAWSQTSLDTVKKIILQVQHEIGYASDQLLYGVQEYFETPTEAFAKKRADCDGLAFVLGSCLESIRIPSCVVLGVVSTLDGQYGHAWVECQIFDMNSLTIMESTKPLVILNDLDTKNPYADLIYEPCMRIFPNGSITKVDDGKYCKFLCVWQTPGRGPL